MIVLVYLTLGRTNCPVLGTIFQEGGEYSEKDSQNGEVLLVHAICGLLKGNGNISLERNSIGLFRFLKGCLVEERLDLFFLILESKIGSNRQKIQRDKFRLDKRNFLILVIQSSLTLLEPIWDVLGKDIGQLLGKDTAHFTDEATEANRAMICPESCSQ